jgi:hypothetical protein
VGTEKKATLLLRLLNYMGRIPAVKYDRKTENFYISNGSVITLPLIITWSIIIGLLVLFTYGTVQNAVHANVDASKTDQSAYLSFAKKAYEKSFEYTGGRNRMPLFPWIQALFYSPSLGFDAFFAQAKMISIIMSIILLVLISIAALNSLTLVGALSFTLIAGFSVLIFRAPYVQTEPLFYALFFITTLVSIKMLTSLKLQWAFLAGLMLGLTHLSKAATIPLFILTVCMILIIGLSKRFVKNRNTCDLLQIWYIEASIKKIALVLAAFVFAYLSILSPYLIESKQKYGRYFYNVSSTFYMWYDSWEEAKKGTRAHGDRTGWPDLPDEEIPSLSRYLRTHTAIEIGKRFYFGFKGYLLKIAKDKVFIQIRKPVTYALIYMILTAILLIRAGTLDEWINPSRFIILIYYLLLISGYFVIASWLSYLIIASRYVGYMCMPLIFVSILMLEWVPEHSRKIVVGEMNLDLVKISHTLVIIWIIFIDVPWTVFYLMRGTYFGN